MLFSKITPSLFTLKEGSTSHPDPLSSGAREETALLGARNRYALRLADHQRSSPYYAGWDRQGYDSIIKEFITLLSSVPATSVDKNLTDLILIRLPYNIKIILTHSE